MLYASSGLSLYVDRFLWSAPCALCRYVGVGSLTCRWYRRLFNGRESKLSCRCLPGHVWHRGRELRRQFWGEGVEAVGGTVLLECLDILQVFVYCSQVSDGGSVSHRTNHFLSWGFEKSWLTIISTTVSSVSFTAMLSGVTYAGS